MPRFFDRCRYPAAAGCCSLERTSRTKVEANLATTFGLKFASSTGGPGPVFCLPPEGQSGPICGPTPGLTLQLDTSSGPFGPFLVSAGSGPFLAPGRSLNLGQTSPSSAASTGWRSGCSGTHLGATGGTQNTLAPNRNKARQLRCTRQGLVRVPLSNTKYGGNDGKTGGDRTPVMEASISESSGIPKRKNLPQPCGMKPSPAVHRASIYSLSGIALQRLTYGYGKFGLACP